MPPTPSDLTLAAARIYHAAMALFLPLRARTLGWAYFAVLEQPTARFAGFESTGALRLVARTGTTGLLNGAPARVEVVTASHSTSDPSGDPTGELVEVVVNGHRLGRFEMTRTLRAWPWDAGPSDRAEADRLRPSWRLRLRPAPRRFVVVESDHKFPGRLTLESFPATTLLASPRDRRASGSTAVYQEVPSGTVTRPPWAVPPA